jgi:Ca2+-binding RTX toxin-like protein
MEFLLVIFLLSPLAALFSGGGDGDDDGSVDELGNGNDRKEFDNDEDHAVLGRDGNDTVTGRGGIDVLAGQAGNDVISGGGSGDLLLGGAGNDSIYGQDGNDVLIGGAGNDLVQGGAGNDTVFGSGGADTLRGFEGNDVINGLDKVNPSLSNGLDPYLRSLFGNNISEGQIDRLESEARSFANPLPDVLDGGVGNDILIGDTGDTITGGAGVDRFQVVDGPGAPVVIKDFDPVTESIVLTVSKNDTGLLTFVNVAGGVELRVGGDLIALVNGKTAADLADARISVERGSALVDGDGLVRQTLGTNDNIVGTNGRDHAFLAGGGNDTLTGANGADALAGQSGNDVISGWDGGDLVLGGAGDDTLFGQNGDDTVIGGAGNDVVQGGTGNDYLIGSGGADTLRGFDGDDFLVGADVTGTFVTDVVDMILNSFEDSLPYSLTTGFGQNISAAQLNQVTDEVYSEGVPLPDLLEGGNGNDVLWGDAGDTLTGGSGVDTYWIDDAAGGPAVITDYDPANERIFLYVPDTVTDALSVVRVTGGTELRVGGNTLAFLTGIDSAAVSLDRVVIDRTGT